MNTPSLNINDYMKNLEKKDSKLEAKNNMEWDKADFLKMMTVQLKHQDPLNPVSNEDFTNQLASLSAMEAQQNSLSILKEIRDGFSTVSQELSNSSKAMNETSVLSLLNKEVAILTDRIYNENSGDSHELQFFAGAKSYPLKVEIYDASGSEVRTLHIDSPPDRDGLYNLEWDGKDEDGIDAFAGVYQAKIFHNQEHIENDAGLLMESKVEGVRFIEGNITVIIDGKPYPVDAIKEVKSS